MPRDHDNDGLPIKGMNLWMPILLVAAGIVGTAYVGKFRLESNERMDEREHAEFRTGLTQMREAVNDYRSSQLRLMDAQDRQSELLKQILTKLNKDDK